MTDLLTAIALLFAIEGLLYAAMPDTMRRFAAMVAATPVRDVRGAGLISAAIGVLLVWLVRGG